MDYYGLNNLEVIGNVYETNECYDPALDDSDKSDESSTK